MKLIFPLGLVVLIAGSARGQEWTRFRGPNGSGVAGAADVPIKWTDTDYNWRVELPGSGHSSPVLWGNRLFVTCTDKATARRMIVCIDAANGAKLWQREYAGQPFRMNGDNSYAASTPAVDESRVYFCWTSPSTSSLIALNHDGKDVWSVDLGQIGSQHGSGASPIVLDELVILPVDQEQRASFLIAVDRKTGEVRWKTPRKSTSAAASTPCVWRPEGGPAQIIFTSRTEGMAAYDPSNGQKLWQLADILDRRVVGSPVIVGDLIAATCGEGGGGRVLCAVRPGDANRPAGVAYRITSNPSAPYVPTPLYKGELMFLLHDSGTISCVRAATGDLVWKGNLGEPFYGSAVCVKDRLYMMSRTGTMFVVAASDKFALLAKIPLGESSFATPAVANGRIYLRTLTHLMCIGGK